VPSERFLICQVQTLEQAKDAVANDANVLVAQGAEAGGHGIARSTFPLVPAVVDAARGIPVVAAGGVADGRGLAAALMLGAEGVLVGTRFYATQEAAGSDRAKDRIVSASGDKTVRSILFDIARRNVWPAPNCGRVLRNGFSERWRGREAELMQHQDEEATRYAKARAENDFETAVVIAGEAVDLITEILPAAEVVRSMMTQAVSLLAGASTRFRLAAAPTAAP
jgi:nitronate monooxygenase